MALAFVLHRSHVMEAANSSPENSISLQRTFGLGALLIYGVGDILGAGIYALIGKVVSESGSSAWASFSIALVTALLTGLAYAELVRRHPKSGGASYFVQVATQRKEAAFIVGWLLLCVSLVSMATLSRAFVGYVKGFGFPLPDAGVIFAFLLVLGLINFKGIRESSTTNMISTAVEVVGLLLVVLAGVYFLSTAESVPATQTASPIGILEGAALAFYAFIGFEDLANIAEESKNPKKHMPIAIVGSLFAAGSLYVGIGWLAPHVVNPEVLASSSGPLLEVVSVSGLPFPLKIFGVVALFAVANTCLLNFITASRLLYGMAEQKIFPTVFGRVHPGTKTPYISIAAIFPVVFLLATFGELKSLAGTTSILILLVFCATNYSLIRIKKQEPAGEGFRVPSFIPWIALLANFALMLFSQTQSRWLALGFIVFGGLLYVILSRAQWIETHSQGSALK